MACEMTAWLSTMPNAIDAMTRMRLFPDPEDSLRISESPSLFERQGGSRHPHQCLGGRLRGNTSCSVWMESAPGTVSELRAVVIIAGIGWYLKYCEAGRN
jgi:hypothetical protein